MTGDGLYVDWANWVPWLIASLPENAAAEASSLPKDVLGMLYPNVRQFGPNGDNVVRAMDDLEEVLSKRNMYGEKDELLRLSQSLGTNPFSIPDEVELNLFTISASLGQRLTMSWSTQLIHHWLCLTALDGFCGGSEKVWAQWQTRYEDLAKALMLSPVDYRWQAPQ